MNVSTKEDNTFRKENVDIAFYLECKYAGIRADTAAGIARMQVIAKQMGISCTDDELVVKFLKARSLIKERQIDVSEMEKTMRIGSFLTDELLKKIESKNYFDLWGNEKRIWDCLAAIAQTHAKIANYTDSSEVFQKGGEALYSFYAKKETDWAVHGGIASAIAGGFAGVAVAWDIQRKNAEARAYNDNLRQSIGRFVAEQQINAAISRDNARVAAEEKEKRLVQEVQDVYLKLVDEQPQKSLLRKLLPRVIKTTTNEDGTTTFTVKTNGATLTIYETVRATVDGSFKIKVMDNDTMVGEVYVALPYKGSFGSGELMSTSIRLPQEDGNYRFVFEPHNLFVIEL